MHKTAHTANPLYLDGSFTQHPIENKKHSWLCAFLAGLILRSTIVKLLQHRIGMFTVDANGEIPPSKSHIPTTQQVRTHKQVHSWSACTCSRLLQTKKVTYWYRVLPCHIVYMSYCIYVMLCCVILTCSIALYHAMPQMYHDMLILKHNTTCIGVVTNASVTSSFTIFQAAPLLTAQAH